MDHIIQFNGTWESLVPLIIKIQGVKMTFNVEIGQPAINLIKEIPALVSGIVTEEKKIKE